MEQYTNSFFDFLSKSLTAYHAAAEVAAVLRASGFEELSESAHWELKAGGRYFVVRNGSSVIAFILPKDYTACMPAQIVLSHLDSPAFRIKLQGITPACNVKRVEVTPYGGVRLATWFDRPLGIAGRRINAQDGTVSLVAIPNAAVIPNVASHLIPMNERNTVTYNPQTDMQALLEISGTALPVDLLPSAENAIEPELFLVDCTAPVAIGKGGMINAPRLDNLSSAYPQLKAITQAEGNAFAVAFFADNEEIGNLTAQGASSEFLPDTLRRIQVTAGKSTSEEDWMIAMSGTVVLSADAAHAMHPNYQHLYDSAYAPMLGQGVAIKSNVLGRYCTSITAVHALYAAAEKADVPLQNFMVRADTPCGTTVGPVTTSRLGCIGVDIGVPMFAMHSIRETASIQDIISCEKLMKAFFN